MAKRFTEEVDDIIQCCICTEIYTNPKVLPCVHTFCHCCLETYAQGKNPGDEATCPLCRHEFTIPPGGMALLPHNFLVATLIAARQFFRPDTMQPGLMCDLCSEGS